MKKNIYVMLMAAALIGLLTGCGGKKDVAYQSNSSAIDNFDFEIEETGVGEGDEYGVESLDFYDGEPGSEAEEMSEANTATNEPVYAEEGNADMKFAVRSAKGFLALPELTGAGTLAWADVAGEETIPTLSKSAGDVLATWIVLDKCTVEAAEAQYVVPLQLRGNSEATEYEIHDPYDLDYMNIMGALSPKSLSEQVRQALPARR